MGGGLSKGHAPRAVVHTGTAAAKPPARPPPASPECHATAPWERAWLPPGGLRSDRGPRGRGGRRTGSPATASDRGEAAGDLPRARADPCRRRTREVPARKSPGEGQRAEGRTGCPLTSGRGEGAGTGWHLARGQGLEGEDRVSPGEGARGRGRTGCPLTSGRAGGKGQGVPLPASAWTGWGHARRN